MNSLPTGIAAEETPDKASLSIVWMPRAGKVLFIFFMAIYIWLMYSFTPEEKYDTDSFGTKILFYLMFLGMFSPMIYLAMSMWLNKTIIELNKDNIVIRYKLPYWFRKTRAIPQVENPFKSAFVSFSFKGSTRNYYEIEFDSGGKAHKITEVGLLSEANAITTFLNQNLKRLRGANSTVQANRKADR